MKTIQSKFQRALCGLAASLLLPVGAFADGTDNFNDNSKDTAKWGTDVALGSGVLTEQNQQLEYTCNNVLSADDTLRPWKLERMPVNADWSVQLDTANSTAPAVFGQVNSGGFSLLHPTNATSEIYVEMYAVQFGKGFDANLETDGVNAGNADTSTFTTGSALGTVRMEYNSLTKVVTCLYDTNSVDGYQWTVLTAFGLAGAGGTNNTDWALANDQQFAVWVYGYSEGMTISSGQLYLDNFAETGGATPAGPPSPVPVGNFQFGFPTGNPLLTAIANLSGNYTGIFNDPAQRPYEFDVAQDESGKLTGMGTMGGCTDPEGGTELSVSVGAVTTVNNQPTLAMNSSFSGSVDGATASGKGTASGPLVIDDIGGGTNGVDLTCSLSAKADGVPIVFKSVPVPVPTTPSMEANLKKDWLLTLEISNQTVKGKPVTVASALLTLPNGDVISFPQKKVKYSTTKGYKLSFKKGTNTTVNPNRLDKKSSISIAGMTFVKQGDDWQPTGGTIAYSFLGQRGTANLLDFTGP